MQKIDLPAVLARIERRLTRLELKAQTASKMAGKPDAIRNLKRAVKAGGRKGISTGTIAALAPVLKTTVAWLLEGFGSEEDAGTRMVQIVGHVGAGSEAFFEHGQGPFDETPAPDGATDETVAVEIRGTSLGELFDGWIIFFDDRRDPLTDDLIGFLCVVGLDDGRIMVKKVKRGRRKGLFDLLSNTEPPIYDVKIIWAARVKQMAPR